jgi:hypothetical protein
MLHRVNLFIELVDFLLWRCKFRTERNIPVDSVVARPTDRGHLLWKVAHVVDDGIAALQSFVTALTEPQRLSRADTRATVWTRIVVILRVFLTSDDFHFVSDVKKV